MWKHVFVPTFDGFRSQRVHFREVLDWVELEFGATFAWNDSTKGNFPNEVRRYCGANIFYFDRDAEAFAFRLRWS
jgi:hypothetical protein